MEETMGDYHDLEHLLIEMPLVTYGMSLVSLYFKL